MSHETRKRVLHGLRIAAAGVTLVVALALVARSVILTDGFALADVEVTGTDMVDPAEVRGVLGSWLGTHVLALDLDAMAAEVLSLGWVREVRLETDLPDRLEVDVIEYEPRLIVKQGRDLWYVDEAGHPFAGVGGGRLRDLPVLTLPNDDTVRFERIVPEALELIDRYAGTPLAEKVSGVHYDLDLGYSVEFGSVEVYAGWEPDTLTVERVQLALSWLPDGARVPAAVIGVAGSEDLVVRLFGGVPEEVRVTAR